jgi:esterase/lipase superfamily enzyme
MDYRLVIRFGEAEVVSAASTAGAVEIGSDGSSVELRIGRTMRRVRITGVLRAFVGYLVIVTELYADGRLLSTTSEQFDVRLGGDDRPFDLSVELDMASGRASTTTFDVGPWETGSEERSRSVELPEPRGRGRMRGGGGRFRGGPMRGSDDPPTPPRPTRRSAGVSTIVWYATNRAPLDPADPGKGYGPDRGSRIHCGRCEVFVPEGHRIGEIGNPLWKRILRLSPRDDHLRLEKIATLEEEAVWSQMREALREIPAEHRHAVVFIHGYNVSFEEAALRSAQIGYDLQVPATAFFSWPSRGRTGAYLPDGASIEASEVAITDFLVRFARLRGSSSVHVIAHSMGNRGLLRAINRIVASAEHRAEARFNQIILAAPDVDRDTFTQLASAYRDACERTTLYVSARDRAVGLSELLHDADRVGYAPPVTVVPGIDTVNVTGIDLTLLGHGYVAAARPVLADMHRLIFEGTAPDQRFGLRPMGNGGAKYWQMAI